MAGGPIERQVCESLAYNLIEVVPNHAALAGLIAGFSLAGFILTVERTDLASTTEDDQPTAADLERVASATLFALAALVGALAAYQYSASTGDHCLMVALEFSYPSTLLATSAVLMVSAIAMLARSVAQLATTAAAVRLVLYGIALLVMLRIGADLVEAGTLSQLIQDLGIDRPTEIEAQLATTFVEQIDESGNLAPGAFTDLLQETGIPPSVLHPTLVLGSVFIVSLAAGLAWRSSHQATDLGAYERSFRTWGRALGWSTASAALLSTLFFSIDTWNGMLAPNYVRSLGILLSLGVPLLVAVLPPPPFRRAPGALARLAARLPRIPRRDARR